MITTDRKMMCSLLCVVVASALPLMPVMAEPEPVSVADKSSGRAAWMDEAKFGLFIHWGLYSQLGRGEWVMSREKIPVAEYEKLADTFNPVKFDADEWVQVAKNAGMKYITITSKHHDGFALFKSEASDYNMVDATPFKRDVIHELSEACEREGIKLGLYYSQAQDWHYPGGSGRKWEDGQKGHFQTYINQLAIPQLKEILTQYNPAIIWFDTPHAMTPEVGHQIIDVIRTVKPDTLANSRLMYHGNQVAGLKPGQLEGLKEMDVDYLSYRDRTIPENSPWDYWETCMTLNNSWGFNTKDNHWKTPTTVIKQLVEVVSKGGTFLLNVGPTAEGIIPEEAVTILAQAGEWLKVNGEAIYGATPAALVGVGEVAQVDQAARAALEKEALATGAGKAQKKGHAKSIDYDWLATARPASSGQPAKLYLHVFKWPAGPFEVAGIAEKISKVYLLSDPEHKPLKFVQRDGIFSVELPENAPNPIATVVCLELNK